MMKGKKSNEREEDSNKVPRAIQYRHRSSIRWTTNATYCIYEERYVLEITEHNRPKSL